MLIITITVTKNNVAYTAVFNGKQWTRTFGVFGIKNAYKRFKTAIEDGTRLFISEVQELNPPKIITIKFNGYRTVLRNLIVTEIQARGWNILKIVDTTSIAHNGCFLKKEKR